MDLISIILSILGAIGGFIIVKKWIGKIRVYFKRRRLYSDALKDCYYHEMEVVERWAQPQKKYTSCRKVEITSLCNGLAGMRTGVGHNDSLKYDLSVEPDGMSLKKLTSGSTMQEWDDWEVSFPEPLSTKDKIEYILYMDVTAKPQKYLPDSTSFLTERRMDKLILRVSFSNKIPASIWYKIYNSADNPVEQGSLEIAKLTNEVKRVFTICRPGYTYAIEWTFS